VIVFRRALITLALVYGIVPCASAQTQAVPSSTIALDVPDVPTVAAANASIYKLYVDALPAVTLAHTCVVGTPIVCSAPVPAMTAGAHALQATRSQLVNGVLVESPRSSTLNITMLIFAAPQNLRIVSTP